jgi:hypothetical protein
MIYACAVCKAASGTRADGITPLGRLANAELRKLKKEAYALLSPHLFGDLNKRKCVFKRFSEKMGIHADDCRIGHFDEAATLKAIEVLKKWPPRVKKAV